MSFKEKYLKYKLKYLNLKKKLRGGGSEEDTLNKLKSDQDENTSLILKLAYTDGSRDEVIVDVDSTGQIQYVLKDYVDMNKYDVLFEDQPVSPDKDISDTEIESDATLIITKRPTVELIFQQYHRGGFFDEGGMVVQHTGYIRYPRKTDEIIWTTVRNYKLMDGNIGGSISSIYKQREEAEPEPEQEPEQANATSASGMHVDDPPVFYRPYTFEQYEEQPAIPLPQRFLSYDMSLDEGEQVERDWFGPSHHIPPGAKWSDRDDLKEGSFTLIIETEPEFQFRMASQTNGRKEFTLLQTLIFDEEGKLQMVGGGNASAAQAKTRHIIKKLATINFLEIYEGLLDEEYEQMEETFENHLKKGWQLLKSDTPKREFYFKEEISKETPEDDDSTEFILMRKQEQEQEPTRLATIPLTKNMGKIFEGYI